MEEGGCSLAEGEGVLEGFEEAGAVGLGEGEAVLDDGHAAGLKIVGRGEMNFADHLRSAPVGAPGFVGAEDLAVEEDAEVALLAEKGKEIRALGIGGDGDREGDEDLLAGEIFEGPGGGGVGRVGADFLAAVGVVAFRRAGEEELQVVVDFGQGADGRAGGADAVFLLDGDGGRDAVDVVDVGLVHAVEELPDVGREGLDVAALALGVEGVEGERGLAGAGGAGDDGQLAERDIEVEGLEVVLAGAADGNDGGGRGGLFRGHGGRLGGTAARASGVCGG